MKSRWTRFWMMLQAKFWYQITECNFYTREERLIEYVWSQDRALEIISGYNEEMLYTSTGVFVVRRPGYRLGEQFEKDRISN